MNELPRGWREVRLGDVCLPVARRSPRNEGPGEFVYVDISAIDNTTNRVSNPKRLKKSEAPSRAVRRICAGDVIFSLVRPYLRNVARVPSDLDGQVASSGFAVLRAGPAIDQNYLFHAVTRPEFIAAVPTRGHHSPSAREDEFLGMTILIAPLEEQRMIVEEIEKQFTRIDEAASSLRHAKRRLKVYSASILRSAVSGMSCEVRLLSDVAQNLDRMRVPVNAKEREKRPGVVPYYGATGQVGWIADYLFDEELVLLGEDGAPFLDPQAFKAYIIRGKSWVNNHAHVLRAREEMILPEYLTIALNTADYHGFVSGTTRLKLTQAAMNGLPIPTPSLAEQRKIIKTVEERISITEQAGKDVAVGLQEANALRQAILTQAFRGELAVDRAVAV